MIFAAADRPWLFGRSVDLAAFGGSALLSLVLLGIGAAAGIAEADAPPWVFFACVIAVDVAHVWSTAFRVYLDGSELRRRPLLYFGIPALCYVLGVAAYAVSPATFWRVLAYVAVFHFVRQQYGWVALYRRRAGEKGALDRILDTAAIYAATVYPLIWWHGHLPRRFHWFVQGDFVEGVARPLADALLPLYVAILPAFAVRQLVLVATRGASAVNAGKVLIVFTTWLCWWLGIMVFDGDYAFTVTNVLIHGIPYLVLTYRYADVRARTGAPSLATKLLRRGVLIFLAFVLAAAFFEETLWDQLVWHEHLGAGIDLGALALTFLVPLLALPQAVHYALDGFIWRARDNPAVMG